MSEPKPSVGRIVHYHGFYRDAEDREDPPTCFAAIVTSTSDAKGGMYASLAVIGPNGMQFYLNVPHESVEEPWRAETAFAGGTWHWPERV